LGQAPEKLVFREWTLYHNHRLRSSELWSLVLRRPELNSLRILCVLCGSAVLVSFRAINKAEIGEPHFTGLLSTENAQRKPQSRRERGVYADS